MRVVIQRVRQSKVVIEGETKGEIGQGLNILLGVENADSEEDADWLAAKISSLRIFNDENDVMNLSINDVHGDALVISQFTLHARTKKGARPSYVNAAKPDVAIPLYEYFVDRLKSLISGKVKTGVFGADMKVLIDNDGPVTILIDSKNKE